MFSRLPCSSSLVLRKRSSLYVLTVNHVRIDMREGVCRIILSPVYNVFHFAKTLNYRAVDHRDDSDR